MNKNFGQKGFTLIEVLVSIVLFSVVLLLFSTYFVNNTAQSTKQDTKLIAANLARQTAEEWKAKEYDDLKEKLALDPTNTSITLPDETIGDQAINGRTYKQKIKLTAFPDSIPIIVISVSVYDESDQLLATLNTGISSPEEG